MSNKGMTENSWNKAQYAIRKESTMIAREIRREGHIKAVEILGPQMVRSASEEMTDGTLEEDDVPLAAIEVRLDDPMLSLKMEIVKASITTTTKSNMLGSLDPALLNILRYVIKGERLYKHNIGEFFDLYGKFEERHKTRGSETKAVMIKLLEGKTENNYKKVKDRNGVFVKHAHPLPYAVRNHLAH